MPTFREAARKTHERLKATFTSKPHAKRWMRSIDRHVMSILADLPVGHLRCPVAKPFAIEYSLSRRMMMPFDY